MKRMSSATDHSVYKDASNPALFRKRFKSARRRPKMLHDGIIRIQVSKILKMNKISKEYVYI